MRKGRENNAWKTKRGDGSYIARGAKDNPGWGKHRRMRCPTCNRLYEYFRMPITRHDVYMGLIGERDEGKRHHVTLRTFLGKMHEIKMNAWGHHIEACKIHAMYIRGDISHKEAEEFLGEDANNKLGTFIKRDWAAEKRKRKMKELMEGRARRASKMGGSTC